MSEVSDSPISSRTFSDPDDLESTVNQQQDFHVMQLDLRPLKCHLLHLKLDEAEFSFRTITSPLRVWGEKDPDFLTFEFLMAPASAELLSHGRATPTSTLYGFDSNRGIDMVIPANVMIGSLHVQRQIFQECLQVMQRTDIDDRFLATNAIYAPSAFAQVLHYLRELHRVVQQQADFLKQPDISRLILDDYVPLLIEAIPSMGLNPPAPSKPKTRTRLVRRAEDYMLANLERPITLKDLCKILNTSSSPLNYGFQDLFGLSPMAYLKRLRLYAVHKTLKDADPTVDTVQSIAHRFGFWHAGRLSQDYKQMFGQLPSVTLQTQ